MRCCSRASVVIAHSSAEEWIRRSCGCRAACGCNNPGKTEWSEVCIAEQYMVGRVRVGRKELSGTCIVSVFMSTRRFLI
jgi:hypothetical protein